MGIVGKPSVGSLLALYADYQSPHLSNSPTLTLLIFIQINPNYGSIPVYIPSHVAIIPHQPSLLSITLPRNSSPPTYQQIQQSIHNTKMLTNPHIDSTALIWPNSNDLKQHLSLPLALSLRPFPLDPPTGTIPPEDIGKYRCQSCKAFINQLCFIRSQNQYDCALCGCTNYLDTPIDIRMPELNSLTYKLPAPQRQRALTTQERLVVFLLDLSDYGREAQEYLLYSVHIIRQFVRSGVLNQMPVKVAVVGFDSGIVRYVVNSKNAKTAQKIISSCTPEQDQDYFPNREELMGDVRKDQDCLFSALEDIEQCVKAGRMRKGQSKAIMDAIAFALRIGQGYSGKIFLVTGLRHELQQFHKMRSYDLPTRHSFSLARKHCIAPPLQKLVQSTQLSLWAGMLTDNYVYNMPFHYLTKMLNGQLCHYFHTQHKLFFYQFKEAVEQLTRQNTGYETLMRVRYSTGLKMVGVFGSFRPTKVQDQVELLTTPSSRSYTFEFMIEGKIASDMVFVQFSTLATSLQGERYFLVQTHCNRVSGHIPSILSSVDYGNVNTAYVRGIVHNLDLSVKVRQLQLVLQERCKRHVRAVRETIQDCKRGNEENNCRGMSEENRGSYNEVVLSEEHYSRAKPYIVLTFLMMKHFLLNANYPSPLSHDLNAFLRSQIATRQPSINIIWPMVYSIHSSGWQLIQMQQKHLSKATVAIFVDRCDQQYVHLRDPLLQGRTKVAQGKQVLVDLIQNQDSLAPLKRFIGEFMEEKGLEHVDMLPLEDLSELRILDVEGGKFGFDRFIAELIGQK